jgi:hypothetical protein
VFRMRKMQKPDREEGRNAQRVECFALADARASAFSKNTETEIYRKPNFS